MEIEIENIEIKKCINILEELLYYRTFRMKKTEFCECTYCSPHNFTNFHGDGFDDIVRIKCGSKEKKEALKKR